MGYSVKDKILDDAKRKRFALGITLIVIKGLLLFGVIYLAIRCTA